ncbi:hypothetical protein TRAPUB_12646 [Trametes pubescens]|uniref:C2H2-type domain-containing protein n=1 Tax=Trametes pubescens TaxID=154538 RepID=A0A1M2VTB0_TRAPU|nr:hypothetical protein TRAPUB_12646 [Trametes pubescens]
MYDQPDSFDWPYQSIGYAPLINLPFNGDYPGLSELPELAKLVDLSARNPSPHSSFASVAETRAHSPTPDHTSPVDDDALAAHRTHASPPSRADVAPRVAEHCYGPPKGTTPEVDEILPGSTTSSVPAASQGTKSRRRAPGRASAPQRRSLRCAQLATARPPMPPPPPPPTSRASTRTLAKLPARRVLGAPPASTSRPIRALPSRAARPVALHPSSAVTPRASSSRVRVDMRATCAMSVDDDMSDSDAEDESDCEEDEDDDGSGEYTAAGLSIRPETTAPRRPLKRGRKATASSTVAKKRKQAQERLAHPERYMCGLEACPGCSKGKTVFSRSADRDRHEKAFGGLRWQCPCCGAKISREDATRRHIRSRHPEVDPRDYPPVPLPVDTKDATGEATAKEEESVLVKKDDGHD